MNVWRRGLFTLAWSLGWSLQAAGRAATYLAAGALTREELRGANDRHWDTWGKDERYILSGLLYWEEECYDRFLRPGDTILVVGCGTGRELIAFARRRHAVTGIEPVGGAVEIARQMLDKLGLQAHAAVHHGPVEAGDLAGAFDVVIFSWCCYGYIPESRARVAVLRKTKAVLNAGGRIILFYVPATARWALAGRLTRLVAWLTRADWTPENGDHVGVSFSDRKAVHFEHPFEQAELEAEARSAGLRVLFQRHVDVAVCVLTGPGARRDAPRGGRRARARGRQAAAAAPPRSPR